MFAGIPDDDEPDDDGPSTRFKFCQRVMLASVTRGAVRKPHPALFYIRIFYERH